MPTPQDQGKKLIGGSTGGAYCGVCGVPGVECTCGQYTERGAGAVKAGSATADKGAPMKGAGNGNDGAAKAEGGEEKKGAPFGGAAKPFGKKE